MGQDASSRPGRGEATKAAPLTRRAVLLWSAWQGGGRELGRGARHRVVLRDDRFVPLTDGELVELADLRQPDPKP